MQQLFIDDFQSALVSIAVLVLKVCLCLLQDDEACDSCRLFVYHEFWFYLVDQFLGMGRDTT